MKKNIGKETLLAKKDWGVEGSETGNDENVLVSQIMNKAQERILDIYKPVNKIAFVSLCTSTRPYSKGRKWKKFKECFKDVDLIINSNGGVIPICYDDCYPYMTYDAHGEKKFDDLYVIFSTRALIRFFILKKYDYILFNFRPTLRNVKAGKLAGKYLKSKGHIKGYSIIPDLTLYSKIKKDGFRSGKMFPDLDPLVLEAMRNKIDYFNKQIEGEKRK